MLVCFISLFVLEVSLLVRVVCCLVVCEMFDLVGVWFVVVVVVVLLVVAVGLFYDHQ